MDMSKSAGIYTQNQKFINTCRRAYRLTARDNVKIFTLPKGKASNLIGTFIYKPLSGRARSLQSQVYELQGRIRRLQYEDLPKDEKAKKLQRLQGSLRLVN